MCPRSLCCERYTVQFWMHLGQRVYTIQHACTLIISTHYVRIHGEEDAEKSAAVLQHFFFFFRILSKALKIRSNLNIEPCPGAEVLLLIPDRLLLKNGKRGSSQWRLSD